jgi:hypothetical protein
MTKGNAFPVYRLFNQGDIPALPDGWRSVIALPPGRKWITIIDWTTLETARLNIATWHRLRPLPDARINRRKVRAVMCHRLKYTASPQAIAEALRRHNGKTP